MQTLLMSQPNLSDTLQENNATQVATIHQQRELLQYTRRLSVWMEREVGERHDDLQRLRALFEQIGRDVRDLQDDESTSSTSANTALRAGTRRNESPINSGQNQIHQPRPIVVTFPAVYAPRPPSAIPTQATPRQLLPPPPQPTPVKVPPLPSRTSAPPSHGVPEERRRATQLRSNDRLPLLTRQSMGSDVNIIPLSTSSAQSSHSGRMAGRSEITRGIIPRTASQRSLVVTSSSAPLSAGHVNPGPSSRPAGFKPITIRQQAFSPQPAIPRPPSPLPAAETSISGPGQIQFPVSRPLGSLPETNPVATHINLVHRARTVNQRPSVIPPQVIPQKTQKIRRRASQNPVQVPQPIATQQRPMPPKPVPQIFVMPAAKEPITRRQSRPQLRPIDTSVGGVHTTRRPTPFVVPLPSPMSSDEDFGTSNRTRVIRKSPSVPIVMQTSPLPRIVVPARTETLQRRQSHRPVTVVATPAVTPMSYPQPLSRRASLIIPQQRLTSSGDGFPDPISVTERPTIRRRSRSLSHRVHTTHPVLKETSPARLIKKSRSMTRDSAPVVNPPQINPHSGIVVPPARTESKRGRQRQRQIYPIATSTVSSTPAVTAVTYPGTVSRRPSVIFQGSSTPRGDFLSPVRTPSQPAVHPRRLPSRSPQNRPETVVRRTSPSRLTKKRPQPDPILPSQPIGSISSSSEQAVMPARRGPQNRPTMTSVTALTYPGTFDRPPTPFVSPERSPATTDDSFRASTSVAMQPAVVRQPSPRSSARLKSHSSIALPIPIVPASLPVGNIISPSGPGIVLMPARRSNRSPNSDSSSVVIRHPSDAERRAAEDSNDALGTGSRSYQAGAVVVPLDSETEELMGFPVSRRASFSGKDLISYPSSSPTESYGQERRTWDREYDLEQRSYSSDGSATPLGERSRSPRPDAFRHHGSHLPANRQLKKSRSHSHRRWYHRPSSSVSDNISHQPPTSYGRNDSFSGLGRRETWMVEGRSVQSMNVGPGYVARVQRGELRKEMSRISLAPELMSKRVQGSNWLKWMDNL